MSVHTGPYGTKEKPTMVPSLLGERVVGCICKCTYIMYMYYCSSTGNQSNQLYSIDYDTSVTLLNGTLLLCICWHSKRSVAGKILSLLC